MMRLLQALAISIPAWLLCYVLLAQHILWTDECGDLVLLVVLAVCTVFTSALAFLRCDLRVSLRAGQTLAAPDAAGSRANIAFLLTGLALGLFPTLLWATKLANQREEVWHIARGVEILAAYEDLSPGDALSVTNVAKLRVLRSNLTNYQFYPEEAGKLEGAKAITYIPARTPIIASQIEGFSQPPERKRNAEVESIKELRL